MANKKAKKGASNKAVKAELGGAFKQYMDTIEVFPMTFVRGQIIKGTVVQISKGQILVDVGGRAEGVVSGREMKLEGENMNYKVGEEILVYVIKGENELGQIE